MFIFEVEFVDLPAPNSTAKVLTSLAGKVNHEPWAGFGAGVIFVCGVKGARTKPGITPARFTAFLYCEIDVSGTADCVLGIPVYSRESFNWLPEPNPDKVTWIPDPDTDVTVMIL